MTNHNGGDLPVLVVAPFGRDGHLIAGALQRAGIRCELCPDPRAAIPHLANGTGAVLIEEEAFDDGVVQEFAQALQRQPAWSDAPLVVLTKGSTGTGRSHYLMANMRQPLGHTTLLERPIRPETLISTVETVLRARRRQFQVRDALEQLQASEARYRSLVLATSSIVWLMDAEGNITEPLPSWDAYTGQEFGDYAGRRWLQSIHPVDRHSVQDGVARSMASLEQFQFEFRLRRHDGVYRAVVGRAVPVFDDTARVKEWVGTITDIQDRKDSEMALRRSESMAVAGQMAATIAHEINNPLEAVTNLIYLIATRSGEDEIRSYADLAQRELARVAEISGQALRFYRKTAAPVDTDLAELMESLLQIFQGKFARRNLHVRVELRRGITISAFPNELRQLFANLINNGIDATPPGGQMRIIVRPDARGGRRGVRVLIADNGTGIPAEVKSRIFQPFVTTKGDSGTGLGLWVCDDVVHRHGGTIRLRTRTGQGSFTVFCVFLPAGHEPQQHVAPPAAVSTRL